MKFINKFFSGMLCWILTVALMGTIVAEDSGYRILASAKAQAVQKMKKRLEAASVEILGPENGEYVKDFLDELSEGGEFALSATANMGIYVIGAKKSEVGAGSSPQLSCDTIIVVQPKAGSPLADNEKAVPEMCVKRVGDWVLLMDEENKALLDDDELLRKIVEDVAKKIDGDIVVSVVDGEFCRKVFQLQREDRMIPEYLLAFIGCENFKKCSNEWSQIDSATLSVQFANRELLLSMCCSFKKGSKKADYVNHLAKGKSVLRDIVAPQDTYLSMNICQNINREELAVWMEYVPRWLENCVKKQWPAVDRHACTCADCRVASCKCCSGEINANIQRDIDACEVEIFKRIAILRKDIGAAAKVLLPHSTGDFYAAISKSDVGYICAEMQSNPENGASFAENFDQLITSLELCVANKMENYRGFKVYDIQYPKDGQMFCAVNDRVFIGLFCARDIADLQTFIDCYKNELQSKHASFADGLIADGDVDLAHFSGIAENVKCRVHYALQAKNDALLCRATIKNEELLALTKALRNSCSRCGLDYSDYDDEVSEDSEDNFAE
ncbi:MAG: hypothetical protein LBI56_01435 [Puniceicoccales bacterium]|jgi:hypothetical protein|nr:hypothetical protein [Puniceicoccales bacterium]